MITPVMLGTEARQSSFHGAADIVWDGKYFWVSSRDTFGQPALTTITAGSNGQTLPQSIINVVSSSGFSTSGTIYVTTSSGPQAVNHTSTNFPTNTQFTGCTGGAGTMSTGGIVNPDHGLNKIVWVIDPSTGIPRVIQKIDLAAFPGRVVRSLNVSANGLYIYVCLAGFPTAFGANPAEQCSCLVINKNTFQIVGNARVSNALIGGPFFAGGGRAVYGADDGSDHLWVVNSNQSNGNAVERFSLAAVLANGVTPTSSVQLVNVVQPHHAEELAYGNDGFFYTSASDYTTGVSRINASTGAITHAATTHLIWGPKFFFGALWGGDFGSHFSRLNTAAFGTGSFETDFVTIPNSNTALGGCASDGTFLWTAGGFNSDPNGISVSKLSTTGGSVAVVKTLTVHVPVVSSRGAQNLAFDGQYIWGVQRVSTGICALFKIDPTPGSEKVLMVWPTGGVQSQQI